MVECSVGTLKDSYFGTLSSTDGRSDYSFIVAIDGDTASMMDVSSDNAVPARMLDMQTGLITSGMVRACQLVELTPHQIAFCKLRCIIHAITTNVDDVRRMELLTPAVNF